MKVGFFMTETTQLMRNRRSIRTFSDKEISNDILEDILLSARQAPSSINAQQTSLIVIKDKERLEKIEQICNGFAKTSQAQAFIIIAMDFYKTNVAIEALGQKQYVQESIEGVITGAVDAGIMAEAISVAAESYGIGNTMIGAIRNDPQQIIDLCQLPKYTFPLLGIMLGYPDDSVALNHPKQRLDAETFIHHEHYHSEQLLEHIQDYDQFMDKMNQERNLSHLSNYSQQLSKFYTHPRLEKVKETLEKQGFDYK